MAASSSAAESCRKLFRPILGLLMISTAPAAKACSVVSAPFSVSDEQITTGVGRSAMILRKKVMPSMRGISTSSRMTSGHCLAILPMANNGSEAVPMTCMSGSRSSKARTT